VAEGVLAARVDNQSRLEPTLLRPDERRKRSVVVSVAMAQDQGVGAVGIDAERAVVLEEVQLGQAEVKQHLSALAAPVGLQVVGQPMLGEERHGARAEPGALYGDRVQLARLREDVVDVIDHVRHH
jgi:hypothetical protein